MGTDLCCRRKQSTQTVENILKLLSNYEGESCLDAQIHTEVPVIHLGGLSGRIGEVAKKIRDFVQEHFSDGTLSLTVFRLKIQNGRGRIEIKYQRDSKCWWDTVTLEFPDVDSSTASRFMRVLHESLDICEPSAAAMEAVPPEVRAQFEHAFQHTQNLTGVAESLVRSIAQQSEVWNDTLRKQQADLDQRLQQRQEKLQAEVDAEKAKLQKAQEELAAKAKAFDDRESRHVRRQLLTQIEQVIEKRKALRLSDSTCRKRWPVHVVCLTGMVAFGALALASRLGITEDSSEWPRLLGMITGGLGIASTFVYYIRFNQIWLDQHANAEMETMKFEADILRASWLTELVFEWQQTGSKEGTPFPEQLIGSFSKGLFDTKTTAKGISHPTEDLVKAFGSVSKLKVGKGVLELEKSSKEHGV